MPITPTEAAELTPIEISQLMEFTRILDAELQTRYTGDDRNEYTIELDPPVSSRITACIINIYKNKGWDAKRRTVSTPSFTFRAFKDIPLHTGKIKEENKYSGMTCEEIRLASIDIGDEDESITIQDTGRQRDSDKENGPGEG